MRTTTQPCTSVPALPGSLSHSAVRSRATFTSTAGVAVFPLLTAMVTIGSGSTASFTLPLATASRRLAGAA